MKLLLFGATGKTGEILLRRLLEKDHDITVYARNAHRIEIKSDKLVVVEGDVLDYNQISRVMKGHDMVVTSLGGHDNSRTVLTNMVGNIVEAMADNNIDRIIHVSTAGIHDELSPELILYIKKYYDNEVTDHKGAAKKIMSSNLTYTIVRPLHLTDGPLLNKHRVTLEGVPEDGNEISREDVADFLLDTIENGKYINKSVGLSY